MNLLGTQLCEWDFLRKSLTDFSLRDVDGLRDVEAHAKALSGWIRSLSDAEFFASHSGGKPVAIPSIGNTQICVADYALRKRL